MVKKNPEPPLHRPVHRKRPSELGTEQGQKWIKMDEKWKMDWKQTWHPFLGNGVFQIIFHIISLLIFYSIFQKNETKNESKTVTVNETIHTEITSYSKASKFCIPILYIWESVFLKFQAFSHSFTLAMDKMFLGGRYLIMYSMCPRSWVQTLNLKNFSRCYLQT